ncbi:NAD(P)/FAD-dependent oxidoreductase [Pseudomonas poae]|uniref:NAD(P)/FAD-dependent oxidoreductase n=1 Tax=Pseudomonas poae TaxID=200451 RepID=UPI0034D7B812
MSVDIDCVVVGAGVVGLAVAREMARAGHEVLVIEAGEAIGIGTSSRNSEVIHAGIYYPPGSLKARFCVEGRHALYAYCLSHGVDTRRTGKLIVANTDAQAAQLEFLLKRGLENGVDDLRLLDRSQASALEPALECIAALYSPSTGIVDSHALMLALQGDAEAAGTSVAFHAPLIGAKVIADGFLLDIGGDSPMQLSCRRLINSAGLHAPALARSIEGLAPDKVPRDYLCKGSYFSVSKRVPFTHLIYPAPEADGLGVHMTVDLGGQARFGPDTEWVDIEDYQVDPARADGFYSAIRSYWPDLPDDSLQPGYSGIRPKISPPGEPASDFVISSQREHGVPGLINLFGIESPGLTSCLALANHVRTLIESETPLPLHD